MIGYVILSLISNQLSKCFHQTPVDLGPLISFVTEKKANIVYICASISWCYFFNCTMKLVIYGL